MNVKALVLIPIALTSLTAFAGEWDGVWQQNSNSDVYRQMTVDESVDYYTLYNGGNPGWIAPIPAQDRASFYNGGSSGWQSIA